MAGTSSEQPEAWRLFFRFCSGAGRGKKMPPTWKQSCPRIRKKESCEIAVRKAMVSATDIRVAGPVGRYDITRDHLQYCQERQTRWGYTIPQLPSSPQAQETAGWQNRTYPKQGQHTRTAH